MSTHLHTTCLLTGAVIQTAGLRLTLLSSQAGMHAMPRTLPVALRGLPESTMLLERGLLGRLLPPPLLHTLPPATQQGPAVQGSTT